MGNTTSGEGNNLGRNGNQTPLNKFIEEVMNEDYFFTPNVSDNMINEFQMIYQIKVLLKHYVLVQHLYLFHYRTLSLGKLNHIL